MSLAIENDFERRIRLLLLTHRASIEDVAYTQVVHEGMSISESIHARRGLELPVLAISPSPPRRQPMAASRNPTTWTSSVPSPPAPAPATSGWGSASKASDVVPDRSCASSEGFAPFHRPAA